MTKRDVGNLYGRLPLQGRHVVADALAANNRSVAEVTVGVVLTAVIKLAFSGATHSETHVDGEGSENHHAKGPQTAHGALQGSNDGPTGEYGMEKPFAKLTVALMEF